MAETILIGVDGSVTLPSGHAAKIKLWNGDFQHEIVDVTNFTSGGYRERRGGLKGMTGSAMGYPSFDAASTAPGATSVASAGSSITLTAKTGCTYSFTAVISNIRFGVDVEGNQTITFDFVSSGTITEAWDVT